MAETVTAATPTSISPACSARWRRGSPFVITHRGRSVARLVPQPSSDDRRRLTPEQEQGLAESIAWARSLKPPAEPSDLPADWPRNRDELYDEMLRERSRGR